MDGDINFISPPNKHVFISFMDFLRVKYLLTFYFLLLLLKYVGPTCNTKLYALHAYSTPRILYIKPPHFTQKLYKQLTSKLA